MTTLREAALAALALVNDTLLERTVDTKRLSAVGRDLEAAIAAEPAQPVAWRSWTGQCGYGYWESQTDADLHSDPDYRPVPLYAAPPAPAAPARLTDEYFVKIAFPYLDGALMEEIEMDGYALLEILRAVEAEVLRRMGVVE